MVSNKMETSEWIEPTPAAALFGVHRKTLHRWAKEEGLTVMQTPTGRRRYLRSEIEALRERLVVLGKEAS